VPVGLHNPQCVGNGEVGIDERAYVEEITGIIVGCTNSKEQGESRESTEEAHTENESSNRSCKKKRMWRGGKVGKVERVDGWSYSPAIQGAGISTFFLEADPI
jgi:hypothetical protein